MFVDRARCLTATVGTGTLAIGAAVSGYQTFTAAGVSEGQPVSYVIEDAGNTWEIGVGIYSISGTSLTRPGPVQSTNSNALLVLTGAASVYVTATAADLVSLGSSNNGRNLLHNAQFLISQHGSPPFTVTGLYPYDRWLMTFINGTMSVSGLVITDALRAFIGDEEAEKAFYVTVTGGSAAGDFSKVNQRIEDVARTSNKTITVSFWAWGSIGKFGAGLSQYFGTGGSPSATVSLNGQSVNISSTPARYRFTFNVPSAAGKVFGNNGTDYLQLHFFFSAGASSVLQSGGVGVQSGWCALWGVQLEIGAAASAFEKSDPGFDLVKCQRFYQASSGNINTVYGTAGSICYTPIMLPVALRAVPTVTITPSGGNNWTSVVFSGGFVQSFTLATTVTALGLASYNLVFTAAADL